MEVAEPFFELTLEALKDRDARSDRLTFKAKIKLGNLCVVPQPDTHSIDQDHATTLLCLLRL